MMFSWERDESLGTRSLVRQNLKLVIILALVSTRQRCPATETWTDIDLRGCKI